ncbi:bifunctional 4-hydroxy-2-oxoglutarate aldolase/2-dehydro-3-deoxy-phosphogluconate aldolase [Vibrio scophthalmi]|mgnify:CR=1 FL=1|uniref:2-dehydro-3-deoxy-phosphogluconate aldolase n=1 Tax=Vibrio scophthalmi TaxID=45658 RepID=A0A1C7FGZ9_9VIBR|nr:bifunctional 4-hydroxy-2-oxoglutarate aldolase/2-dehydro-3-deoxy-phosphogluconate aldolase [Vibrio scophthalmi]ANU38987.1 2-dehydro-3-deoxy-phosphogluconate aldolase [Vibrio scophthalmi]
MNNWKINPADVFAASPIVPVMVIEHLEDALPMAKALLDGGISVFEITLRTEAALAAIQQIADAFPNVFVGAGTVLNPEQYDAAVAAGAQFIISPGMTPELIAHAKQSTAPLIPGVATPTEVMTALAQGFTHLKFFPAEANGGVKSLSAIAAPLPQVRFCPTGGISPANVKDYMALDCVATVGGTWMLPKTGAIDIDWSAVTDSTKQAVALLS